jgi:hypothetical protein
MLLKFKVDTVLTTLDLRPEGYILVSAHREGKYQRSSYLYCPDECNQ